MKRETVKKLLPIITAFAEGKTIQYNDPVSSMWYDLTSIEDYAIKNYKRLRIKPSPTYRPFANAEECWQEMLKHQPFLKYKAVSPNKDVYLAVVRIKTDGIETDVERLGFSDVLRHFTFADGSAFGVKVDE